MRAKIQIRMLKMARAAVNFAAELSKTRLQDRLLIIVSMLDITIFELKMSKTEDNNEYNIRNRSRKH